MAMTPEEIEAAVVDLQGQVTLLTDSLANARATVLAERARLRALWAALRERRIPDDNGQNMVELQAPITRDEIAAVRYIVQERKKVRNG